MKMTCLGLWPGFAATINTMRDWAYGAETFGERFADVYDTWYGTKRAEETTQETAAVLAELAGSGTVLGSTRFPCATPGPVSSISWRVWPASTCATAGAAPPSRLRVRGTSRCTPAGRVADIAPARPTLPWS
jgi:hypothetical protein